MAKLHILYHHRTMGRGAEGVHIRSMVQAFKQLGHSVDLISPLGIDPLLTAGASPLDKSKTQTRGINSLWKAISKHAPQFIFELIEIIYNIPGYFKLSRVMKNDRIDFIYERYAFFMLAGVYLSKRYNIPLVLEVNEVSGHERARGQTFLSLCGMIERYVFSHVHAIVTVSSQLRCDVVCQRGNDQRVLILPNAINPNDLISLSEVEKKSLRARFGLYSARTIGFLGWFDEWDRLDLLIEVFADLAATYEDLNLVLIGDGPMRPSLETIAIQKNVSDRIVFTGPIERLQVFRHIALLDIAVLPHSNAFGSPVVLFEFMGMHVPVVAPRLRPIEDVLIDKSNGLLFEPLDKVSLTQCIITLMEDPCLFHLIQENAYNQVLKKHTWVSNAEKVIQVMTLNDVDASLK